MKSTYRIIDANINRAAEGIRVLEDTARFRYDNEELVSGLRLLRHDIRDIAMGILGRCLDGRNSTSDVGREVSAKSYDDSRETLEQFVTANFKRVQEALRNLEENLKLTGRYREAKKIETLRFKSYTLEKKFYQSLALKDKQDILYTDLYCITCEEHSAGRTNIEVVEEMLKAGIKIIQYREKNKSMKEKYSECREIRKMTRDNGAALIVNDHIDLAVAADADGVHLGQDDMPVPAARDILGSDMIIGVSTHSPEQARKAVEEGAGYIGVGPIFRTCTKENVCDPVGLEYLDYVVGSINIPFVTIGGIKEHNIGEVLSHGARCVALVTEITGAPDIRKKIRSIRERMRD